MPTLLPNVNFSMTFIEPYQDGSLSICNSMDVLNASFKIGN